MKSIMLSINPKWVAKIMNGEKEYEIRKTKPNCELPIDVYIYCTKDRKYANLINRGGFLTGMVVAKFTLKWCDKRSIAGLTHSLSDFNTFLKRAGIDWYKNSKEFHDYVSEKDYIYAWHISNLVIFDKPKELSEFGLKRAPESWQYVEME